MVGLARLVQQNLADDPLSGALYTFRGRRAGLTIICKNPELDASVRLHPLASPGGLLCSPSMSRMAQSGN